MIHGFRNQNRLLLIGMWFLACANLWHWFAPRVVHISESIIDGSFGLMTGVAIGCLLLSIVRRRRCPDDTA
jgi:hypothetical protein